MTDIYVRARVSEERKNEVLSLIDPDGLYKTEADILKRSLDIALPQIKLEVEAHKLKDKANLKEFYSKDFKAAEYFNEKDIDSIKRVNDIEDRVVSIKEIQEKYQDLKKVLPENDPLRQIYYKANYAIEGALAKESQVKYDREFKPGQKSTIKDLNNER